MISLSASHRGPHGNSRSRCGNPLLEEFSDHDSQFLVVLDQFAQLLAVVAELLTAQNLTHLSCNQLKALRVKGFHLCFQTFVFTAESVGVRRVGTSVTCL